MSIQYVADETGFHATGSHVPQVKKKHWVIGSFCFLWNKHSVLILQIIIIILNFANSNNIQAPPMPPAIRRMLDHLAKVTPSALLLLLFCCCCSLHWHYCSFFAFYAFTPWFRWMATRSSTEFVQFPDPVVFRFQLTVISIQLNSVLLLQIPFPTHCYVYKLKGG